MEMGIDVGGLDAAVLHHQKPFAAATVASLSSLAEPFQWPGSCSWLMSVDLQLHVHGLNRFGM